MIYHMDDSQLFSYAKETSNEKSPTVKKDRYSQAIKNIFSDQMNVLFLLLTIIGAMPLSKNKEGEMSFKIISIKTIYSILVYAAVTGTASYILWQHMQLLNGHNITFDDKIKHYAAILFMAFHFLPLCCFCEGKKIAKYCTSYVDFQVRYYNVTKKNLVIKLKVKQYIMLVIFIFNSIFFYIFLTANVQADNEKYNISVNYPVRRIFEAVYVYYMWVIQAFAGSWVFLNLAIWQTAKNLLNDVKDARLRSNSFNDLYALWLDLRNLTEDLGSTFSWTYIYYLIIIFLMVMGSSYTLFTSMTNPESDTKFGFLGSTFLFSLLFGIIADCAHKTKAEVGENFSQALLIILSSETNPNLRKEIKWFLQTISINSPVISLAGYVNLTRGFNVSMLGSLVTYIVVVLQFKTSTPSTLVE